MFRVFDFADAFRRVGPTSEPIVPGGGLARLLRLPPGASSHTDIRGNRNNYGQEVFPSVGE